MLPNNSEPGTPTPPVISERFAAFLAKPLPDPNTTPSTDRIAYITTAREAIQAGVRLPENILKVLITLISVDRTEAAKAARSAGATARKASKSMTAADVAGKIAGMSDEDAADAL